jgi:hypothetical protein
MFDPHCSSCRTRVPRGVRPLRSLVTTTGGSVPRCAGRPTAATPAACHPGKPTWR